jgi:hypothetical protein
MIFKNILGVHSKASNLAIQTELGYCPICIKSYKLMFKYYSRLVDIESNCDFCQIFLAQVMEVSYISLFQLQVGGHLFLF